MTKNFTQTIKFPASVLLPPIPEMSASAEVRQKLAELQRFNGCLEDRQDLVVELRALLEEPTLNALAAVNAQTPIDEVPVSIHLGEFLFELYERELPEQQAPLRAAQQRRQLQELAVRLAADSFELTKDELEVLKKTLDDEEKWSKISVRATVGCPKGDETQTKSIRLVPFGLKYYGQILNACIDLYEEPKPEPAQEEKIEPKKGKKKKSA